MADRGTRYIVLGTPPKKNQQLRGIVAPSLLPRQPRHLLSPHLPVDPGREEVPAVKWDLLRIIGKRLRYLHVRLPAPIAAAVAATAHSHLLRLPLTLAADQLVAEMPRGVDRGNAPDDVSEHPV